MRLIDADLLKAKAFGKRGGLIHTSDIDEAPTVDDLDGYSRRLWKEAYERGKADAHPQRMRGRWVETEKRGVLAGAKYYKCDICAQAIVVVDSTPMADGYNYCPRCGSEMREGEE